MILNIPDLNIDKIMRSGECFRLTELSPGRYLLPAFGRILEIYQTGEMAERDEAEFFCTEEELENIWSDYFDLKTDYREVRRRIDPSDGYLTEAAEAARGIRILKQDLWEVMVSFVISQNNNIPRIRKSIDGFSRRFGTEIREWSRFIPDEVFTSFGFPAPERLRGMTKAELSGLSLGYRDEYIVGLVRAVNEGSLSLDELKKASYREAKSLLVKQAGIGNKVADCICLFGLRHTEAFPLDTHMKRILAEHYPNGFPLERYGASAGILQQFMFYDKITPRNPSSL